MSLEIYQALDKLYPRLRDKMLKGIRRIEDLEYFIDHGLLPATVAHNELPKSSKPARTWLTVMRPKIVVPAMPQVKISDCTSLLGLTGNRYDGRAYTLQKDAQVDVPPTPECTMSSYVLEGIGITAKSLAAIHLGIPTLTPPKVVGKMLLEKGMLLTPKQVDHFITDEANRDEMKGHVSVFYLDVEQDPDVPVLRILGDEVTTRIIGRRQTLYEGERVYFRDSS